MARMNIVERKAREQCGQIKDAYRRRHRTWVWTYMPAMPDDQWTQYTAWVADFWKAAPTDPVGQLKVDRKVEKIMGTLDKARARKKLPGTVTHATDALKYLSTKHARMRFAMDMECRRSVHEDGLAKSGRATRQK